MHQYPTKFLSISWYLEASATLSLLRRWWLLWWVVFVGQCINFSRWSHSNVQYITRMKSRRKKPQKIQVPVNLWDFFPNQQQNATPSILTSKSYIVLKVTFRATEQRLFRLLASSLIPLVLLSSSFLRNPDRFVLVGSPFTPQLQTLVKAYPSPDYLFQPTTPITLRKKNLAMDEDQGEMINTVYLRPGIHTLYLPLLDTLDTDHFIGWQGYHALRQIVLVVSDIESLSSQPHLFLPLLRLFSDFHNWRLYTLWNAVKLGMKWAICWVVWGRAPGNRIGDGRGTWYLCQTTPGGRNQSVQGLLLPRQTME